MKTTTRHQDSESCHQSLEHELLEVVVEDGVLHVSEHQADVLRVDGGGEVVVQRPLLLVPASAPEALHQKLLDVS